MDHIRGRRRRPTEAWTAPGQPGRRSSLGGPFFVHPEEGTMPGREKLEQEVKQAEAKLAEARRKLKGRIASDALEDVKSLEAFESLSSSERRAIYESQPKVYHSLMEKKRQKAEAKLARRAGGL